MRKGIPFGAYRNACPSGGRAPAQKGIVIFQRHLQVSFRREGDLQMAFTKIGFTLAGFVNAV